MRIAIVDDRAEDQSDLTALLEQYCTLRQLCAEWVCFPSGEALLSAFSPGDFALVFLDIYMGGMSGMDAAKQLSTLDNTCRIIFVTISHTHAVESYAVRAAYYLTKPLEPRRFFQAMDAVCSDLLEASRHLLVHSAGVRIQVPLRDILYVDCRAERTQLHLKTRLIQVDERFSEIFSQLTAFPFFLNCNRNVAVNMDWISQPLEGDFLLKNGESVPIRQRGRGEVKKKFLSHTLRELRNRDWP